jgi:hypothetical protein
MLTEHKMAELLDECSQLCNIIGRSIVTTREKPGEEAFFECGFFALTNL